MPGRSPVLPGNGSRGHPLPEAGDVPTPREVEVVRLIAQGKTDKEIGLALGISNKTIQAHVANVKVKADARNRVELVLWWLGKEVA